MIYVKCLSLPPPPPLSPSLSLPLSPSLSLSPSLPPSLPLSPGLLLALLHWVGLICTARESAAYQNFLITIEMFLAAVLLKFAFSYKPYQSMRKDSEGRGIPMQKVSSHFKDTINPQDVVTDAIHNFSRVYQQYAQQGDLTDEEDRKEPVNYGTKKTHLSNGRVATFTPLKPSRSGTNVPNQLESDDERVILLVETDEEEIYQ